MRKERLLKLAALVFFGFSAASCDDPPNSALTLKHSAEAIAVTGSTSNCTDKRGGTTPYPQSVTADFFTLASFGLDWKGSNELVPAELTITLNHPYLEGGTYECALAGTSMEDTFGVPPYPAATLTSMNGVITPSCSLACGGIKRKPAYEETPFSTIGTIEFKGYSQNSDGTNLAPVRATSRVRVSF